MRGKKPFNTIEELQKALNKAIEERDDCSSIIKSYTDDWVEHQKKIIDIQETLEKLNK